MNDFLKTMLSRVSVKSYTDEPVKKEDLELIIKAGISAPSGLNKQAPIVVAVTDKQTRDTLSSLNAGKDPFKRVDPFYGAPCVLVVLADKSVPTYPYDGPLVMENMMLAAHSLGLGACWIHRAKETFETEEGKALLKKWGIEGDYEGIGNCIVGYPKIIPEQKPRKENRVFFVD